MSRPRRDEPITTELDRILSTSSAEAAGPLPESVREAARAVVRRRTLRHAIGAACVIVLVAASAFFVVNSPSGKQMIAPPNLIAAGADAGPVDVLSDSLLLRVHQALDVGADPLAGIAARSFGTRPVPILRTGDRFDPDLLANLPQMPKHGLPLGGGSSSGANLAHLPIERL